MMVPRSFRYSAAPPMEPLDEKRMAKDVLRSVRARNRITSAPRPVSPARTTSEPARTPTQPVSVPTPERPQSSGSQSMPTVNKAPETIRRKPSNHDPNALPPSVAALLAMTEIPRPKRNQFQRRRSAIPRRISLDELVNEWKNDEFLISSFGSSPGLSVLLEDPDGREEPCPTPEESVPEESFLYTRSVSAESMPSLEADDRSMISSESLSTPGSLRSRKSITNLKRDKLSRSLPASEECTSNHPLVPSLTQDEDPDDDFILALTTTSRSTTPKPKPGFKSNLTSSLQALKNAAISSISSFTNVTSTLQPRTQSSSMPDNALWSHPFLFPHFGHEVRPAITGTPTEAQRRYLNPMPPTFEELEGPFQQALHAPFLAKPVEPSPEIELQTKYRRGKGGRRRGPDLQSEAGRALLGADGIRLREPRENSDFLLQVVCEMNMKRSGKLAKGQAKFWLPPRAVDSSTSDRTSGSSTAEQIWKKGPPPRRWVGVSAYD